MITMLIVAQIILPLALIALRQTAQSALAEPLPKEIATLRSGESIDLI